MLPKKRRISKNEFPRHARGGMRATGKYFSATVTTGSSGAPTKCAIVVSGKVSSDAHIRNKIRRRVYEVITRNSEKLKKGQLVVIYARPDAKGISFQKITEDIEDIMKKTNTLV